MYPSNLIWDSREVHPSEILLRLTVGHVQSSQFLLTEIPLLPSFAPRGPWQDRPTSPLTGVSISPNTRTLSSKIWIWKSPLSSFPPLPEGQSISLPSPNLTLLLSIITMDVGTEWDSTGKAFSPLLPGMCVVGMFFQKNPFQFQVLGVHLCFKPWPFLWTPDVTAYAVSLLVYTSFNPQFQAFILYLPHPPCPIITWCPPVFPFSGKVNTLLLVTQVRSWKSTLIPPSHASGFSQCTIKSS